MPNSKHLTHGISNLVSLITKTKLGLSHLEKGHLVTRPVEKGHLEESGLNPPTVAAQRRSKFISICRRAAEAKGINNHIYSLESLQEKDESQLERAATGARPHLARPEGSP
jgi:hypothetical protein